MRYPLCPESGPSQAKTWVAVFFIMRALGELLLYRPMAGSFVAYAEKFLSPLAGLVTGWSQWVMWVVTAWPRSPLPPST
jgi:L-asparagine transporter-like permease